MYIPNQTKTKKRIEFENSMVRMALDSGLSLGTVIKSMTKVLYKFQQARENLANAADVCKVPEYASSELFIDPEEKER